MGQIIQSHGMHFFELAGPDLLLGFDADPDIRNVVGLIQANPELAVKAVQLRKFGQEIIHTVGQRKIHPNFAMPGGVNKALKAGERDDILKGVDQAMATTKLGIAIMKDWAEKNREDIDKFAVFPTGYFGLVTPKGSLELYEGECRLIDRNGNLLEQFPASRYLDYIQEHVENWSYLKFPFYKKMGWPKGVYRVGALGRLNACDQIDTPQANEELKIFKGLSGGKPVENTLHYHYARLIEVDVRHREGGGAAGRPRHPEQRHPEHPAEAAGGPGGGRDRGAARDAAPSLLGEARTARSSGST